MKSRIIKFDRSEAAGCNFQEYTRFLPRGPKHNGSALYLRMQLANTYSQSYRAPSTSKNWNCSSCTKHSKSLLYCHPSYARVRPHVYFTSYIVNDVSSKLPYFFVVVKTKPLGTLGSVSWEMQNGGKQHIALTTNIWCCCVCASKLQNMAAQQVQAYLERHRIGALFEVTIWFKRIRLAEHL